MARVLYMSGVMSSPQALIASSVKLLRAPARERSVPEHRWFSEAIESIVSRIMGLALKTEDPITCGLLSLQLAHTPWAYICDAMLRILEQSLCSNVESLELNDPLEASLLLLGSRKRGRALHPEVETRTIDIVGSYLNDGPSLLGDPKPAALISLLSTVVSSDRLAPIAQTQLRSNLATYLRLQDIGRTALTVFGASPFLKSAEVSHALKLISHASEIHAINSVETLSYCLLASHFGRYQRPSEAQVAISGIIPRLAEDVRQLCYSLLQAEPGAQLPAKRFPHSVFIADLRRCTLALVALFQCGAIALPVCSVDSHPFHPGVSHAPEA